MSAAAFSCASTIADAPDRLPSNSPFFHRPMTGRFRFLFAERPVNVGLRFAGRHDETAVQIADHCVARMNDGAAAGNVDIETAPNII